MSESASFRILIIDDEVHKHVENPDSGWENGHPSLTAQHCDFVDHFLAQQDSGVEIVLAHEAALRKVFTLTKNGRIPHDGGKSSDCSTNPPKVTDPASWLAGFHIVVLDMKGIGAPRDEETLENLIIAHLAGIGARNSDDNTKISPLLADQEVQGVKFYHRYLENLKSARAIIVLTAQDLGQKDTPSGIKKLLWPFCRDENELPSSIPWTVVQGKGDNPGQRISRLIQNLHKDFTDGYAMLTNRGQIEFAAVTDEHVLILGESGTGKEYVANAIRRAWGREKNVSESAKLGFAVLNCGCITDETAHAHLFGAVRNSSAHQPGVILQAAGCHTLGYEKTKWDDDRLKEALIRAEAAASKVEQLGAEQDQSKFFKLGREYLVDLQELLYPRTKSSGGALTRKHSLPNVLNDLKRELQDLMDGTSKADHFKQKLIIHFGGRLVEGRANRESGVESSTNPFDLCFTKEAGVLGTLFLDEFADLPPLAQSLLLRFLESGTREIQPLGYPGIISGVRLRIIAATSDEEIAEKAGVNDDEAARKVGITKLRKRPDGRARAFPVRFDLIQRLRFHTIRVESVTKKNAEHTVETMIQTKDGVKWDKEAIEALIGYVKEECEKDTFNHRRELRRIMDLAILHVAKGHQRGLRGFKANIVTAEAVARFLIPASAVNPTLVAVETPKPPSEDKGLTVKCQAMLQKVMEALKVHGQEPQLTCGPDLMTSLKDAIQSCIEPTTASKAIRAPLKSLTKKKAEHLKVEDRKILRQMFGIPESKDPIKQIGDFFKSLLKTSGGTQDPGSGVNGTSQETTQH